MNVLRKGRFGGGPAGGNSASSKPRWCALAAWSIYDWAGSPFTTLLLTFVFPVYFARSVVGDPVLGQALWSYAAAISGLFIAVLSPVLGAIADAAGRNKPWLFASTAICGFASFLFWFVEPSQAYVIPAIILIVIANVSYATGVVFNNAMLPDLVPKEQTGRWSGWAWALGYAGGLGALVLVFVGFIENGFAWPPLDRSQAENIRIAGPVVALWLAIFAWPRFVWTPERSRTGSRLGVAVRRGFASLKSTLGKLAEMRNIARFLLANMLYADALAAVFAVGGIYAAGAFKMTVTEVTSFGILLNVAAGLGAFAFAWVDDWIGPRKVICLALVGLIVCAAAAVLVAEARWFWIAGLGLGVFVGPVQASSRSLMARLAPKGQEQEFFGLFALSGKATSFAGPLLVALVTSASGSQRAGLASLMILMAAGAAILSSVSDA